MFFNEFDIFIKVQIAKIKQLNQMIEMVFKLKYLFLKHKL